MSGEEHMLNLTPHAIKIQSDDGMVVTIPPSGMVARVDQSYEDAGVIAVDGAQIPVVKAASGAVTGLPASADIPILVSGMVLDALKGRPNTYAPDTNVGVVRNDKGHIQAVTRLRVA
jgi:hypothetical protein